MYWTQEHITINNKDFGVSFDPTVERNQYDLISLLVANIHSVTMTATYKLVTNDWSTTNVTVIGPW